MNRDREQKSKVQAWKLIFASHSAIIIIYIDFSRSLRSFSYMYDENENNKKYFACARDSNHVKIDKNKGETEGGGAG